MIPREDRREHLALLALGLVLLWFVVFLLALGWLAS